LENILGMIIKFFDAYRKAEITNFLGSLNDAPLVGDNVVLKCSYEYEKIYMFPDRTATIESRLIDYRDNSITLFVCE